MNTTYTQTYTQTQIEDAQRALKNEYSDASFLALETAEEREAYAISFLNEKSYELCAE